MPTDFSNTIRIAAPPSAVVSLRNALAVALGVSADFFAFSYRTSQTGTEPADFAICSGEFTDTQVALMRPLFSEGGVHYVNGCRARRGLNVATETTSGEPGKLNVVEIQGGQPIPQGVNWDTHRLSFARFLEDLSTPAQRPVFAPL